MDINTLRSHSRELLTTAHWRSWRQTLPKFLCNGRLNHKLRRGHAGSLRGRVDALDLVAAGTVLVRIKYSPQASCSGGTAMAKLRRRSRRSHQIVWRPVEPT